MHRASQDDGNRQSPLQVKAITRPTSGCCITCISIRLFTWLKGKLCLMHSLLRMCRRCVTLIYASPASSAAAVLGSHIICIPLQLAWQNFVWIIVVVHVQTGSVILTCASPASGASAVRGRQAAWTART